MVLTINTPVAGYRFGPGMIVTVTTSIIGPIPVDDFMVASIVDTTTTFAMISGIKPMSGFHTVSLRMGELIPPGQNTLVFRGTPDAGACQLVCTMRHAGGAIADGPVTLLGLQWDASSGIWTFIGPGSIDGLSAYVSKLYQNAP